MTVGELKDALLNVSDDWEVVIQVHTGTTVITTSVERMTLQYHLAEITLEDE